MEPVESLLNTKGIAFTVSGRDYLIHCLNPDHIDNNPSLRVDRISGTFHCFSCGFKGTIFKHFGVFTNYTPIRIAKLKDKLQLLKNNAELPLPQGAIPYTKSFRGISAKTLKLFEAFYTNQEERLIDRIIFPIKDITGKTQVYVGRHLLSNGNPRYLNYPSKVQMPLYPASIKPNYTSLLLVEGIFDFLNLYDKGLENCVCTFGTNTLQNNTKQKLLTYKTQGVINIYILYDGDDAGEKAAKQLKPLIEECEFFVEILQLPTGTDPGELSQEDVDSLKEYINK